MILEIHDINPKNWLRPFQKNTIFYLLKMGLFYHGLGLVMMYTGSYFANMLISNYTIPQIPVSISLALGSGVLEESVFFGIPFYLSGNPLILLVSGIVWSVVHLFNADSFSLDNLSYGVFFLTIPNIFFSLRVWSSKKGWFAIAFHSMWNLTVLISYCSVGLRQCVIVNDTYDILNVIMAISAAMIIYLAYQSTKKKIRSYLYLIPMIVIVTSLIILFSNYFILDFF
ncbi:MAG: CPBP family intramembrane metalloprotease [Nitrosarchaeum sp.]|nr:CPBP family intramembrane metalloprotease [Nitrosarchaeum sp.]